MNQIKFYRVPKLITFDFSSWTIKMTFHWLLCSHTVHNQVKLKHCQLNPVLHRHCREANRQCQHLAQEIFRCCWKCSDCLSPPEYSLEHGTALRSGGNIHMNKDELISGCSSVFWLPHIFWNSVQCWRCNGENPERTKWGRALWIPLEPGNHWLCGFLLLLGLRCNPSARRFPGLVHSCKSAFWLRYPLQLLP